MSVKFHVAGEGVNVGDEAPVARVPPPRNVAELPAAARRRGGRRRMRVQRNDSGGFCNGVFSLFLNLFDYKHHQNFRTTLFHSSSGKIVICCSSVKCLRRYF